ncbi:adenine nucleotide alpha hydrolase family protein [Flavobacterium ajazii]|uniref:7-cyano-7-deazaguanine synthase n=1 Tax=Flavobacterium ajazii TaxID=2692318 RepID=UPI0013D579F6|nr:7-cyano-7-deazaguanine synthase [Flavobacterium ajazii]
MPTHNLLWTSGWDSTFRLLQIILTEKETVQPIYIIDKTRRSLKKELDSIKRIQEKIKELNPEAYLRILPVWYVDEELTIDKEIGKSSQHIKSLTKMGTQHDWISQFCSNHNLKKIEMCLDKNANLDSFTHFLVTNYIETDYSNTKDKELYNCINVIFKYFTFPVVNLSKQEMNIIAKANNWEDIMSLTWFCHKPKRNKPCGKCVPCTTVIKKKMGFRIPLINRIKGYFKIYFSK